MSFFPEESAAMKFFLTTGMDGVAWSLRRLHCPVPKDALVLEVGSGGNPYARSNVLLDAYEETRERHWAPLVTDRPMTLGFVERMPFQDKAFDFVIASHVLEHSPDPALFLSELERVGKAGYIETPDAFMERVNPYRDHRLEVTQRDGKLIIRKKTSWRPDGEVVDLYENRVKPHMTREFIPRRPFAFHVRYYWKDRIDHEIVNPGANAAWPAPEDDRPAPAGGGLRGKVLGLFRQIFSQRGRNAKIDLAQLLICPTCGKDDLSWAASSITCGACGAEYSVKDGIPVMRPQKDDRREQ